MVGYGGKDLQKRKVLSLEWKSEAAVCHSNCTLLQTTGQHYTLVVLYTVTTSSAVFGAL